MCEFSCLPGYSLGSTWSWSRYAGEGRYGDSLIGSDMHGGAEGPPQHPQMYNFRAKGANGKYEAGARIAISEVTKRTCQADGTWSGKQALCYSNREKQPCIHSIMPRCGTRAKESAKTRVTILGENFDVMPEHPTVTFNDMNVLKDGVVRKRTATELVVQIPFYSEHNEVEFPYATYDQRDQAPFPDTQIMSKTSKGTVVVKTSGVLIQDCRDQDVAGK